MLEIRGRDKKRRLCSARRRKERQTTREFWTEGFAGPWGNHTWPEETPRCMLPYLALKKGFFYFRAESFSSELAPASSPSIGACIPALSWRAISFSSLSLFRAFLLFSSLSPCFLSLDISFPRPFLASFSSSSFLLFHTEKKKGERRN